MQKLSLKEKKIKNNLLNIQSEIKNSTLVAVTKTRSLEEIHFLYSLGIRDFGENRVEDLSEKSVAMESFNDIRWHMIGNIQSKKIRKLSLVKNLHAIHSVSSLKVLNLILKENLSSLLFLQVNISQELEKSGFFDLEQLSEAYNSASDKVYGLMGMSKLRTDNLEKSADECFKKLKSFRDQINPNLKLSMGMSNDYKIALNYESDFIRIGSLLFN